MPRQPRLILADIPVHLIQRGNNRQACFFADDDYLFYLDWLRDYAGKSRCAIHAYVLMTNHVHLLLTPALATGVGQLMKRLGQRYVQYVNRCYRRSGTLWEGRFRSCIAQQENYLLLCQRYIELNPVRAGMVAHPGEYRWSSYRANAQGEPSSLLQPHEVYLALGTTDTDRQAAYRELFRHHLEPGMIDQIRRASNGSYAIGCDRFREQIEAMTGRRTTPGRSGRPFSNPIQRQSGLPAINPLSNPD